MSVTRHQLTEAPPTVLAWHFLADTGLMRDGKKAEVGKTYRLRRGTKPELCVRGFHGSVRPLDSLQYAPGALICRVEIGGEVVHGDDKLCGTERRVLWMTDATRTLHEFSAWAAEWILDDLEGKGLKIDPRSRAAIDAKRKWLRGEINDKELAAARAAARAAAGDAAWAAASAAARAAAWAAARDAAGDAAWAAAGDAAWAAASAAARAAARDAARDAAGAAAGDALNAKLEEMLAALEPRT